MYRLARQTTLKPTFAKPTAAIPVRHASSSSVHENDPETLEREKHRNLSGKQHEEPQPIEEAPGWNDKLASGSEAGVKADRHVDEDPMELQESTSEEAQRSKEETVKKN